MALLMYQALFLIPGLGGYEWLILLVVVLFLLFGAKKIPELTYAFGRTAGEFRKGRKKGELEAKVPSVEYVEGVSSCGI